MREHVNTADVIMSAPNQNRENFSSRLERMIPFFGARTLNKIVSLHNDAEPLQIDMWNSYGLHLDQDFKQQTLFDGVSRSEYSSLLIAQKYRLLEELGIDTTAHFIVRDDEDTTTRWMTAKINTLFNNGIIYEDSDLVNTCTSCGNIISIAASKVTHCSRCDATDINIEKRKTLFIDLPRSVIDDTKARVDLPRKPDLVNGQLATLPERVMVARDRDYGQSLNIPGYEDKVLDPKIGLSLMPEMVAERYGIDSLTQVQGVTTAKNTLPYTTLLSTSLDARYILTPNVPANMDIDYVKSIGASFFTKYLPIFTLDKIGKIGEQQLGSLQVEHSKISRKLVNALWYLNEHSNEATGEINDPSLPIRQAIARIASRDIRAGVLDLRKYVYDNLSGTYVAQLRNERLGISRDGHESIKQKIGEIV